MARYLKEIVAESKIVQRKRREEIAQIYFEGCTAEEISEYSGYLKNTIRNDIRYIEENLEEFLG